MQQTIPIPINTIGTHIPQTIVIQHNMIRKTKHIGIKHGIKHIHRIGQHIMDIIKQILGHPIAIHISINSGQQIIHCNGIKQHA
jgi:hypothetical protein